MAVLPPNPQKWSDIMYKRLFEINLGDNNGYTKEFNAAMRDVLNMLPEGEIKREKDNVLLYAVSSERAGNLIDQLDITDCLRVVEIVDTV